MGIVSPVLQRRDRETNRACGIVPSAAPTQVRQSGSSFWAARRCFTKQDRLSRIRITRKPVRWRRTMHGMGTTNVSLLTSWIQE